MKNRKQPLAKVGRVVACLALLNFAVPGGALVSFGVPLKETVQKGLAKRAKDAKDLARRKAKSASRLLTGKEERTVQGRTGENPYLAGQSKWDVVYKGVNLMTGNYSTTATDMGFDGGYGIPVNVTRSYSANSLDEGPFGKGWTLSADVRSTAGGIFKSGSSPIRSVPVGFRERPATESDPNAELASGAMAQPVEGVTATDAGGEQETVQKDVDGVLTTPPWDLNVNENTQYEFVVQGGVTYQLMTHNETVTPEGTRYVYEKKGAYLNGGTRPWNDASATPQPANVLKVVSATDRQGNVTTYTYGTGTFDYAKSNGTTRESPLLFVSMPGGHQISFVWGSNASLPSYGRVVSISDGSGGRTVGYTYSGTPGQGLLASATSAGGKTTSYGYGAPNGGGSANLLTSITDPRGLSTLIDYMVATQYVASFGSNQQGVLAYKITTPNGIRTYVRAAMVNLPASDNAYGSMGQAPYAQFHDRLGSVSGPVLNSGMVRAGISNNAFSVYVGRNCAFFSGESDLQGEVSEDFSMVSGADWVRNYMVADQNLISEVRDTYPVTPSPVIALAETDLRTARRFAAQSYWAQQLVTVGSYNFLGRPLRQKTTERTIVNSGGMVTVGRSASVDYAYWGPEKYFQQKAVRDQAGRYSLTDYYPRTAPAGKRGQTYRIYDPKNGGIYLDTNAPVPTQVPPVASDKLWRYQITAPSANYSAQFDYDAQGRPTDVWKLQKTSPSWSYVQIHTSYGADGSPHWGQASTVVEDYGTGKINRTTQTLAYTSWGKASKVQNAKGQVFETSFDADGQVNSVTRTDVTPNVPVVTYAYGTSGVSLGQPVSVTDGLSGVVQTIAYTNTGAGVGLPASVTETNGSDSYSTTYTYGAAGDRETATYTTPNGTSKWGYYDYLTVGDVSSPQRAFQTLTRLDPATGARTAEELHYAYDSGGRLTIAAFAQSPFRDAQGLAYAPATSGSSFYDANHRPSRRAISLYAYDTGGRLTSVATNWEALPDGAGTSVAYASTGVFQNLCGYETSGTNRGVKTSSAYTMQNIAGTGYDTRTETYAYDPDLDHLTSANYGDGNPNATPTWTFDAAGNRSDASVVDNLNRATTLGGVAVTNDILGNRLTKGGVTYGWDVLNRMTSLSGGTTASYAYRADGMRVAKTTGGVTTRYRHDGQMGIEDVETQGATTTVTRYGLGARGVDLIERTAGTTVTTGFPLYDAHGNNVATLSRNGSGGYNVGDRRSYDAWGVVRAQQSGGDPKLRYCASLGHKADDESGLIYMRARYYEPSAGRFISEDPAMDGHNWYAYCSNNPVNLADRTGMKGEGWFGAGYVLAAAGVVLALLSIGPMLDKITAPLVGLVLGTASMAATIGSVICFGLGFLGVDMSDSDKVIAGAMTGLGGSILANGFKTLLASTDSAIKQLGNLGKIGGGIALQAGCSAAAYLCAVTAALICIDLVDL